MNRLIILLLLAAGISHAELFMEIGGVTGEVVTVGYEGQISVSGIAFNGSRIISYEPVGTNVVQNVSDASTFVNLTRVVDTASPPLFGKLFEGIPGDTVTLNFVRTSSLTGPLKYVELVFSNVLVKSYGFSAAGPVAYEEMNLDVRQVKNTYYYQLNDGTVTNTGGGGSFAITLMADAAPPPPPVSGFFDPDTGTGTVTGVSGQETVFPPTLSSLSDTNTLEDSTVTIPFRFSDADTPATQLVFTVQSLDSTLIDPLDIQLETGSRSGSLQVTPVTNRFGAAGLRLTVSDGTNSDQSEMTLNILPQNDPPFLLPVSNRIVGVTNALSIPVTVGDIDTPVTNLTLFATSSDTNIVPTDGFAFTGTGSNRVVDIALSGQGGASEIRLGVSDASRSDARSFWVVANDTVSGAPTDITPSPNPLTVVEHSPSNTLVGNVFVTDFTPGGDTFTFRFLDDADGRFQAAQFAIRVNDADKVDFEAGSEQEVLIQVEDSAGLIYSEFIPISILNSNEPPFVAAPPFFAAAFESEDREVGGWTLTDPDPGPGPWFVQLSVLNGTLTLENIPSGITVLNNGGLTVTAEGELEDLRPWLAASDSILYRSLPAFGGLDTLTVELDDQGTSGLGTSLSDSDTLDIRVYAHNLDAWQYETYGPDIDNPALEESLWGIGADPDLDGIANLIEYALGLDPETADGTSWEQLEIDPATGRIRLNVRERLDPRVSVQIVAASVVDESQFSDATTEILHVSSTDLGNGFRELEFQDPRSEASETVQRIYRLEVTYTP